MDDGLNTDYTDKIATGDKFLYHDLSYKIIGCCIKIHNEYGPHHNERIYHKLLEEWLTREGTKYQTKPKVPIYSRESGKEIGYYQPDLTVEGLIMLELKALPLISAREEKQLLEYLKTTTYEVAYLINFGTSRLYYKRIIFTNDRKGFLSSPKTSV